MYLSRMIFLLIIAVPIPLVVLLSFFMPTNVRLDIYWGSFFNSVSVTSSLLFLTMILSLLWSVPTAFMCRFLSFKGHKFWAYALILPIAIPSYLNSFIFSDLFYYTGQFTLWLQREWNIDFPFNMHSTFGAAFILSLSLFPYIFFPLYMRLNALPQNLFDAISLQSDNLIKKISMVALPFAFPIIVFSLALIGMETLADFGTTSFFGVNSLSVFIFNLWSQTSDSFFAIKMSFSFVLFIGALLAAEYWARPLKNISGSYHIGQGDNIKIKPSLFLAAFCNIFCFIPFFLGFLLPFGYFLINTLFIYYDNILPALRLLWDTAYPAFFASLICVIIALWFAYWQKTEKNSRISRFLIAFAVSGYAFPGIILGLVILIVTTFIDRSINLFLPYNITLLSGGMFGLICAYILRFLTIAYGNIKTPSEQLSYAFFEAPKLMGYKNIKIVKMIFLPLLQKPVYVAFILIFIDVLKELPATLLLRPFGFESLATHTYNMAGLEQIAEASPSALMIILFSSIACIVPFFAMRTKKDPA